MKITYNLAINYDKTFIEVLKVWACFHRLLASKYAWQELPETFSIKDCTYSEYEEVPYATIHIYSFDHDISFQKDQLKVAINMNDDDITKNYSISFFNAANKNHNFSIDTHYQEFKCATENPFYTELMEIVQALPGFQEMSPKEITFTKQEGRLDETVCWAWMRKMLLTIYPNISLPETVSLIHLKEEKEYGYRSNSEVFQVDFSLKNEDKTALYFYFNHKIENYSIILTSMLDYTSLKLSSDNPNKDFWEERFNRLNIGV